MEKYINASKAVTTNPIYGTAKILFCRILGMGRDSELAMRIIALWLWLESQGLQHIVANIDLRTRRNDAGTYEFLNRIVDEAVDVISSYLQPHSDPTPLYSNSNFLHLTSFLSRHQFSARFVLADRKKVAKGVDDIYKGVCRPLFQDIIATTAGGLYLPGTRLERVVLPYASAGASTSTAGTQQEQSPARTRLSPFAKEWKPLNERAPEEDRGLFFTFSKGQALTRNQIVSFFSQRYGNCVEKVYVHRPSVRGPPQSGKVFFNSSSVPAMALGGAEEAKFYCFGKTFWCKKVVRQNETRGN